MDPTSGRDPLLARRAHRRPHAQGRARPVHAPCPCPERLRRGAARPAVRTARETGGAQRWQRLLHCSRTWSDTGSGLTPERPASPAAARHHLPSPRRPHRPRHRSTRPARRWWRWRSRCSMRSRATTRRSSYLTPWLMIRPPEIKICLRVDEARREPGPPVARHNSIRGELWTFLEPQQRLGRPCFACFWCDSAPSARRANCRADLLLEASRDRGATHHGGLRTDRRAVGPGRRGCRGQAPAIASWPGNDRRSCDAIRHARCIRRAACGGSSRSTRS